MHDVVTGPGLTNLDANLDEVVEYAEGLHLSSFIGSACQSLTTNDKFFLMSQIYGVITL